MTMKEIEEQALLLSPEERELLAERLYSSLEPGLQEAHERAWYDEAERRLKEYREGRMASRPVDEALREAIEKFS